MADLNRRPRRKKTLQGRRQDHVVLGKPRWALEAPLPLVRSTESHHQPEKNMEKRQKNQSHLGRVDQESGVSIIHGKSVFSSWELVYTFRDFPNKRVGWGRLVLTLTQIFRSLFHQVLTHNIGKMVFYQNH